MNILISKLDTARFATKLDKLKTYGGFDTATLLFVNLAKLYPQHTFYYIGSNDIPLFTECPSNLIDIDGPIRQLFLKQRGLTKYEVAIDYCRQFKFDFAIYWYCRYTSIAKYKDSYLTDKGTPRVIMNCEKNVSHIMAVPVEFKIPVYYLIDDVTELNKLPYDIDTPAAIWTQQIGNIEYTHYNSSTERVKVTSKLTYKPIERLWLQGKHKVDWRKFNKTNRFIVTCNAPSNYTLDRLYYVKRWIFDQMSNEVVYGKWTTNKRMTDAINNLSLTDRFVCKGMCEMEDLMFNTRYTLVIPVSKRHPQFITQKVFSMLYYGIIPFWCRHDYDTDNILSDFPDYLRVESPDDLLCKMDELDKDEVKYRSLLDQLYTLLDDKYFNNQFVHELFDELLNI